MDFQIDRHYSPYGNTYRLKEKVRLVELDNLLLKKFLMDTDLLALGDSSFGGGYGRMYSLYREILPNYLEWSDNSSTEQLDSLYMASRITDYELEKIKDLFSRDLGQVGFHSERHSIPLGTGEVFISYEEKKNEKDLITRIYFIPADTRGWIGNRTDSPIYDYEGCPKEDN